MLKFVQYFLLSHCINFSSQQQSPSIFIAQSISKVEFWLVIFLKRMFLLGFDSLQALIRQMKWEKNRYSFDKSLSFIEKTYWWVGLSYKGTIQIVSNSTEIITFPDLSHNLNCSNNNEWVITGLAGICRVRDDEEKAIVITWMRKFFLVSDIIPATEEMIGFNHLLENFQYNISDVTHLSSQNLILILLLAAPALSFDLFTLSLLHYGATETHKFSKIQAGWKVF